MKNKIKELMEAISKIASPDSHVLLNLKNSKKLAKLGIKVNTEHRWCINANHLIRLNTERVMDMTKHETIKLTAIILKGICDYNDHLDTI